MKKVGRDPRIPRLLEYNRTRVSYSRRPLNLNMLVIYACSRHQYKELEQEYEMPGTDPPLFPYRGMRLDLLVTLGGAKN